MITDPKADRGLFARLRFLWLLLQLQLQQGLFFSAPSRTRTYNLMIKSHLLYQLSYRGEAGRDSTEFVSCFHSGGEKI